MDAEIVDRPAGWVLGIGERIIPGQADYKGLWEGRFMPRHEEIKRLATDPAYYGVYYPCEEAGKADFIAGMATGEGTAVPEGLVLRPLPGGSYAQFRAAMKDLAATWGAIYREWLPASKYLEDETRPAIEYYPPEMTGPESEATIFVAVKPKS